MENNLKKGILFLCNFAEKYKNVFFQSLNLKPIKSINKKKKKKKKPKENEMKIIEVDNQSTDFKEKKKKKLNDFLRNQEKELDFQANYKYFSKYCNKGEPAQLFYNSEDDGIPNFLNSNKIVKKKEPTNFGNTNGNIIDSINSLNYKLSVKENRKNNITDSSKDKQNNNNNNNNNNINKQSTKSKQQNDWLQNQSDSEIKINKEKEKKNEYPNEQKENQGNASKKKRKCNLNQEITPNGKYAKISKSDKEKEDDMQIQKQAHETNKPKQTMEPNVLKDSKIKNIINNHNIETKNNEIDPFATVPKFDSIFAITDFESLEGVYKDLVEEEVEQDEDNTNNNNNNNNNNSKNKNINGEIIKGKQNKDADTNESSNDNLSNSLERKNEYENESSYGEHMNYFENFHKNNLCYGENNIHSFLNQMEYKENMNAHSVSQAYDDMTVDIFLNDQVDPPSIFKI